MKTLSIIGIIISIIGILLTSIIFIKLNEFLSEIYEIDEKNFSQLFYIEHNHLRYIREESLGLVIGFFTFFLVFSIAVNRKY